MKINKDFDSETRGSALNMLRNLSLVKFVKTVHEMLDVTALLGKFLVLFQKPVILLAAQQLLLICLRGQTVKICRSIVLCVTLD